MVDVRSVSPVLTCGTHFLSISGNKALTKDISTPVDIAPRAIETIPGNVILFYGLYKCTDLLLITYY